MNLAVADLAIVGGGAAGLAGAVAAGRLGLRAVVLERTDRPGRKLAITGGRKGNLSHECGPREMAERFDCDRAWLLPLLKRFPYQRIVEFFGSLGIQCRADEDGCIWPVRCDAAGLRDALAREAEQRGGRIVAGARVVALAPAPAGGWRVRLDDGREFGARAVCIATGGASYPQTGSTGDGLALAAGLGVSTVPWFPALASLAVRADIASLAGNTQPRVSMAVRVDGAVVREATGHFIFAHRHVSGSSVLNLCGFAARALAAGRAVTLRVDWAPDATRERLHEELAADRAGRPLAKLANVLAARVSRRLADRLVLESGIPAGRTMTALGRAEAAALVERLKATEWEVVGTEPIERATVVGGGVGLDEVDNRTLESKRLPGLHFAGEVLDIWGETGGYNLHFAWASGIAVAEAVAGRCRPDG